MSGAKTYLGIDLGTSEVKLLLLSSKNEVIGVSSKELTVSRPHPRWSEQNPSDWWNGILEALKELKSSHPAEFRCLSGIGLSGQMHGAVLLNKSGAVLRPAILWNDTRSDEECKELTQKAGYLHKIAGNLAMPGFTAPKLLWIAKHEPQIFKQIDCVMLPKDYLRFRLTGEKVTDVSDAAGTLWLDVGKRQWSEGLITACGLSVTQMPKLVEGNEDSGIVLKEFAREWEIHEDVIVAGGGGDNAVSAVGIGATEPGDGFISLGTSGVLCIIDDGFHPCPESAIHCFCHAVSNRWLQMSVMLSAASCLRWVCKLTSTTEAELLKEVEGLTATQLQNAPIFLPYLSGERTPHNDPLAKGAFFGLTHDTDRAVLGYTVIEGVTMGLADGLDLLKKAGTKVQTLSLLGGGARSSFWAQLIADAFGVPIQRHENSNACGALGAARLGWLATGGDPEFVLQKLPVLDEFKVNSERNKLLRQRFEKFRQFYQLLKPLKLEP